MKFGDIWLLLKALYFSGHTRSSSNELQGDLLDTQ